MKKPPKKNVATRTSAAPSMCEVTHQSDDKKLTIAKRVKNSGSGTLV